MPSPSESRFATIVIDHLAEIAAGRCTITDGRIAAVAETDPVLAEVLTGLLFLHEDLALRVAERDRALAEVVAANRELEAFSYSVAHDLRSPLRVIDSYSRLLAKKSADKLDDQGRVHLGYVLESAKHMAQIIEDLLMLSRVARGDIRHERVDLSEMARTLLDRLQRTEPTRRLEPMVEEGVVAEGDPNLMRVVLENLLGNAWKFTSGRPVARIEVGMRNEGPTSVYFVRDNGAGFDMAYADKMFVAFQRLHAPSEFSGTGIGLAIVQRIIQRHGGHVWAEGAVDRGATVYFTLGEGTPP